MTLEELKIEAQKLGYKLESIKPYIRMLPCICGNTRVGLSHIFPPENQAPYHHKCFRCGFSSTPCKTKYEAKIKWNECIENKLKEVSNESKTT